MTALLAPMPLGDGPKRAHIHLRKALSSIARRVAMKALAEHRPDVLLEVYAAGIAHATELLTGDTDHVRKPMVTDDERNKNQPPQELS